MEIVVRLAGERDDAIKQFSAAREVELLYRVVPERSGRGTRGAIVLESDEVVWLMRESDGEDERELRRLRVGRSSTAEGRQTEPLIAYA